MSEEKINPLGQDTPKQNEPETRELSPQELEKVAGGKLGNFDVQGLLSAFDQTQTLGEPSTGETLLGGALGGAVTGTTRPK